MNYSDCLAALHPLLQLLLLAPWGALLYQLLLDVWE